MRLTEQEIATVLAALRVFQNLSEYENGIPEEVSDYFTEYVKLNDNQIDQLCERINNSDARPEDYSRCIFCRCLTTYLFLDRNGHPVCDSCWDERLR